jgi:5'-deoxynucleotidase
MSISPFPALLSRMKYINRWALMRNSRVETVQEHSLDVSMIAHCLATIRNVFFGGTLDPNLAGMYGVYHDASEILTGDLPTPIKNFNPAMKEQYKAVEKVAQAKLLGMLPPELGAAYQPLFDIPDEYYPVIKAADRISALIKCMDEESDGNREFARAGKRIWDVLKQSELKEVGYFLDHMMPGYQMTLDELCAADGDWLI